jgi:hypothetical protein
MPGFNSYFRVAVVGPNLEKPLLRAAGIEFERPRTAAEYRSISAALKLNKRLPGDIAFSSAGERLEVFMVLEIFNCALACVVLILGTASCSTLQPAVGQVHFRAPTPRTAFEYMTMMEEAIEHGGYAVSELFNSHRR